MREINGLENVPVIFLSLLTDSESEVRGIELGAVDFIMKPMDKVFCI